jgi:hypothetical protein
LESQRTGGLKSIDFVDAVNYFAKNPLGREQAWNYYRANFEELVAEYSLDSPILGQLLIEISRTFEDEYLFYEVIFLIDTFQYQYFQISILCLIVARQIHHLFTIWCFTKRAL